MLAARRDLSTAVDVGLKLLEAKELELVPCSDHFVEAFNTFRNQRGRRVLSFADAAIVAIARAREVEFVASFDQGFGAVKWIKIVPGVY